MSCNKSLGTLSVAGLVISIVILALSSRASAASNYKALHTFTGGNNDGATPFAGLIFDHAGNLYGTTQNGGYGGGGTVFKLTPNRDGSWKESVLYGFCSITYCSDGAGPFAGLVFDQAGGLYGTTKVGGSGACEGGCGVVFKLTPHRDGSWTERVLHNFCPTDCSDGANPVAGLIFDQAGNLYGTALGGGTNGGGTVFKLAANADGGWTYSVLYNFCCSDGAGPNTSGLSQSNHY